jgi:hypothetical protein
MGRGEGPAHFSFGAKNNLGSEEDYYSAVEKHFILCRGSPLFVAPKDWQLIHDWHERPIPLRVVKAGVDRAFDKRKSSRRVRSLSYCRQSVEAEYRRHLEVIAGTAADDPSRGDETREFLVRLEGKLRVAAETSMTKRPRLAEAIQECARRIVGLVEELVAVEGQELEHELERLDEGLFEIAESSLDEEQRRRCRAEAEHSLRDYKDRMPDEVYTSAVTSAYRKRVRALLGLPALSLFYL